ncbi:MAG: glycoside hydrolase family 5 protein [Prevotella sp.]|nr:glycoside hydrolase family 5 protein [Prevotella sp.]
MANFKFVKKFAAAAVAVCTLAAGLSGCTAEAKESGAADAAKDMTTMEVVRDMGLGINLGNTMESSGMYLATVQAYETGWGSPVVTKEMIQGYKDCGFGVLRVPVAWSNLMNARTYEISPDYIARVREIVGWALEADLYVVMNIHWDGGWFSNFADDGKRDKAFEKYESIWTQLSEAFNDFGGKLMFESLNEEGGWEDIWNRYSNQGDKEKSYGILNDMNQRFVNIVRASGGNNETRHLLIAGYATDIDLTCDPLFKMPDDPAGRCAVSVHYYTPSTFAILEKDADWGKAQTEWGSDADIAELDKYMDMVKTTFVDKGIPVIIGEYGTSTSNKTPEMIRKYLSSVCEAAYTRGMCPVLWDITDVFYNRTTMQFQDPELLKELMDVKNLERN